MRLYAGCGGWDHHNWNDGRFYPKGLDADEYLSYYGSIFNCVEIDSTFGGAPDRFTTIRWSRLAADGLMFTARFPKAITFEKRQGRPVTEVEEFLEAMGPLSEKLLAFLITIPPSLSFNNGFEKIKDLIPLLDRNYRYAIESSHESWFTKEFYRYLSENNLCLAWTQTEEFHAPPQTTTDFVYIRFTGRPSMQDVNAMRTQKSRSSELKIWASRLKMAQKKLEFAIVAADNHFGGFGPATVKEFKKMLLPA
ncbi:MAG TPA: DUF72 domain-containing protein [Nitrososphaera sp.]|nr:DUF72 domain-containing protein [Nitrososphaera sp.]